MTAQSSYIKYISLLFLFMLSISISYCQSDFLFSFKTDSTYTIKYSSTNPKTDPSSNKIIEEISKSIPKILEYTNINFNYTIEVSGTDISKVNKKDIKKYSIAINARAAKPFGDTEYKAFNLSEVLLPGLADISFTISESDGSNDHEIMTKKIQCANKSNFTSSIIFNDTLPYLNPVVSLKTIRFYYSDSNLITFNTRTKLIDDYYNSEFQITAAAEKLAEIDLSYVDLIKIYEIKLKEIEKTIAEISAKNFISELGLYSNDPIDFINKYSSLNVKVKDVRNKITDKLSSLDKVYYAKGIEYLVKKDTTNALTYFKKSTAANPFNCSSILQLARIYFYKDILDTSGMNLVNITSNLNPDQATLKQLIHLSDSLNLKFIEKGEQRIAEEDYNEALKILNEGKSFCTNVKVIECSETLLKDIAKAKYGIYSSFITVSQKALNADKLEIARIYISKAKDYQIENSTDIISSQEADDLLSRLIIGLTDQGISLNNQMLFDSALVALENVSELCSKYFVSTCTYNLLPAIASAKQGIYKTLIKKAEEFIRINEPVKAEAMIAEAKKYQQENSAVISVSLATDSLSDMMKEKYYQKFIADGISYLKLHEGINALRCFNTAREIEKNYTIARDTTLDSLINATAKPYVSDYIEKGLVNVWGNEPIKANSIADTVKLLMKKYGLSQDSSILVSLADLQSKISALECKLAEDKYNEYYRNAYQKISLLNYTEAESYFQKCLSVAGKNSSCDISTETATNGISKYKNAAKYQKLMTQSDSSLKVGSYRMAIDKYYEAESFAASANLSDYGLSHTSFDNFIALQNETYILNTSEYFFNKNNIPQTFYCLDLLRKHNFADSLSDNFQKMIALKLSTSDFNANPDQKSSIAITKYPAEDSWFLPFRKSYFSNWKELKKKK